MGLEGQDGRESNPRGRVVHAGDNERDYGDELPS